jgi:hypothetical protein
VIRKREHLEYVLRELDGRGVSYDLVQNGHYKIKFKVAGRSAQMTMAVSPSDHRARLNAMKRVRRLLRGARGRTGRDGCGLLGKVSPAWGDAPTESHAEECDSAVQPRREPRTESPSSNHSRHDNSLVVWLDDDCRIRRRR